MNDQQIREQSKAAIKQWGKQWEDHCHQHSKDPFINNDLLNLGAIGVGKAVLCVANGYSLGPSYSQIVSSMST